jgi:hypothetical protein
VEANQPFFFLMDFRRRIQGYEKTHLIAVLSIISNHSLTGRMKYSKCNCMQFGD